MELNEIHTANIQEIKKTLSKQNTTNFAGYTYVIVHFINS